MLHKKFDRYKWDHLNCWFQSIPLIASFNQQNEDIIPGHQINHKSMVQRKQKQEIRDTNV
ncbi:hypothetical protein ACJIZ3_020523 [Penstemon smallii]|uniref:Uncharacterized protein n=1 Tax=Penstemon smallii TaxID=265156 RepID=A0ABD3SIV0_9LAMI